MFTKNVPNLTRAQLDHPVYKKEIWYYCGVLSSNVNIILTVFRFVPIVCIDSARRIPVFRVHVRRKHNETMFTSVHVDDNNIPSRRFAATVHRDDLNPAVAYLACSYDLSSRSYQELVVIMTDSTVITVPTDSPKRFDGRDGSRLLRSFRINSTKYFTRTRVDS